METILYEKLAESIGLTLNQCPIHLMINTDTTFKYTAIISSEFANDQRFSYSAGLGQVVKVGSQGGGLVLDPVAQDKLTGKHAHMYKRWQQPLTGNYGMSKITLHNMGRLDRYCRHIPIRLRPIAPTLKDVMWCLVLDAQSALMSFDDFFDEFGYSVPSEARRIHNDCIRNFKKLSSLFGGGNFIADGDLVNFNIEDLLYAIDFGEGY